MIIATIYNTKTKEYADLPFTCCEQAERVITSLNQNMPQVGFLMIMDYEAAE